MRQQHREMIVVRQYEPGVLALDTSSEPGFLDSADAAELTTALFVKQVIDGNLLIEDAGRLAAVLSYLSDFFRKRRYKFALEPALSGRLDLLSAEELLIDSIKTGRAGRPKIKSVSQFGIKRPLLPHQRKGLLHALSTVNSANFSVPGSGKTTVALSTYAVLRKKKIVERLMVIGPASSFVPWQEEFCSAFGRPPTAVRLLGHPAQRAATLKRLEGVDILLCTYQMAFRDRAQLISALNRHAYLLVLDESHHIKNITLGPWANTVLELAPYARRRMILTGTPAPHSLRDLWSQFTFLWPSKALLGSRPEYEQRIEDAPNRIDELTRDLKPFFLRTKRSDLHLPEPIYNFSRIPYASIPKRQRLIIRLLELRTIQEARDKGIAQEDVRVLRQWRRARTLRLLQASSNPALLSTVSPELGSPGEPLDSDPALARLIRDYSQHEVPAKIAWTAEKVRYLVSKRKKVVVWASFVGNLLRLRDLLRDLNPLLAYGGVPAYEEDTDPQFESRERNIRDFKHKKDRNLLLANPGACSESISLHQVCQDAIYLERTFNCGQFLQSMDRILRVGMPKHTRATYHIPVLSCAIEEVLDRRLAERQQVLYRLLDDDMPVLGYQEDWTLFEQEEDLDAIFHDVLEELSIRGRKVPKRTSRRTNPRR